MCVECGACIKSGICSEEAFVQKELHWPRSLRAAFSDPLVYHKTTSICGRGTTEVKTNDVSNRIGQGEVGIVIEVGRPCVSTSFYELEKLTTILVHQVTLAKNNPVTHLLNITTGRFKESEILEERVLSAIIECKTKIEKLVDVLKELRKISDNLETVFSLGLISRYEQGEKELVKLLEDEGFTYRINGKVNIGLGRPKL